MYSIKAVSRKLQGTRVRTVEFTTTYTFRDGIAHVSESVHGLGMTPQPMPATDPKRPFLCGIFFPAPTYIIYRGKMLASRIMILQTLDLSVVEIQLQIRLQLLNHLFASTP